MSFAPLVYTGSHIYTLNRRRHLGMTNRISKDVFMGTAQSITQPVIAATKRTFKQDVEVSFSESQIYTSSVPSDVRKLYLLGWLMDFTPSPSTVASLYPCQVSMDCWQVMGSQKSGLYYYRSLTVWFPDNYETLNPDEGLGVVVPTTVYYIPEFNEIEILKDSANLTANHHFEIICQNSDVAARSVPGSLYVTPLLSSRIQSVRDLMDKGIIMVALP